MSPAYEPNLRLMNHLADTISAGAIVGTILGLLPPMAALAGIIWYCVQIYESKTVQKHIRRRRARARQRRRDAAPKLVVMVQECPPNER